MKPAEDNPSEGTAIGVEVLAFERGATRLALAPGDARAALDRGDQVDVVDVRAGTVERSVPGVALGAPGDDGTLAYLEPAGERRWLARTTADPNRTTAIEPPDGRWRVEAALGAGGSHVVVLAGVRRFIASLGSDLGLRATTLVDQAPQDTGPTVALSPQGDRLYVLSGAGGAFTLAALAMPALTPLWTTALEAPPRAAPAPDPTAGDSDRARPPPIPVEVAPWGDRPNFLIQPSGDGSRILVVGGEALHGGIADPQAMLVVTAADGRVVSSRRFAHDGSFLGHVRAAAAVPGTPQVVLLHVSRFREGSAETPSARFGGLTRFDLAAGGEPDAYVVSPEALGDRTYETMKAVIPSAIAVTRSGVVLLAR